MSEQAKSEHRWALPICTGCGGILGCNFEGGCTCEPSHAKTGKNVEVVPVSELDRVREERDVANNRIAEALYWLKLAERL